MLKNQSTPVYDVIIVGGGLSGLIAAHELRDCSVLVLEKEGRAGGRILTRIRKGVAYDLGAVFACDPRWMPFDLENEPRIHEDGPIGIFWHGSVLYGGTVGECLAQMDLKKEDLETIRAFEMDPARDARSLPGHIYEILNAFFQVIHPGEMKDYLPVRQADSFIKFDTAHYQHGNGAWLEKLAKRARASMVLDVEVTSVLEENGRVQVTFVEGIQQRTVCAKAVILTSPAPVVLKILKSMSSTSHSFLNSVCYGEGIVVALCFQGIQFPNFTYIVTPGLSTSMVMKQRTLEPERHLVLSYYAGEKAVKLKRCSVDRLIAETLDCLRQLEIGPIRKRHLHFADCHRWPMVGPIVSAPTYAKWDEGAVRPSSRVFLAGDYVHVTPPNVLPYGLVPAILAGQKAARTTRSFLMEEGFKAHFLVKASRYELTPTRPLFRGTVQEGNIALYGLILQAHGDEHLKRYLLHSARDFLWEWQSGFGVTAEDSAIVMEGLLASGVERHTLLKSIGRLVKRFFSRTEGAFLTIRHGRAAYWRGPCVDATGHIGYLLLKLAPDSYPEEAGACAEYLRKVQMEQGCWRGKWFPSTMVTTYYAVRFLHRMGQRYVDSVQKSIGWILASQDSNGSWNGSVIETSAAMLALTSIHLESAALPRAAKWLSAKKGAEGWEGEPILYYWFEIDSQHRLFYHCEDNGEVTTAWARLALSANRN